VLMSGTESIRSDEVVVSVITAHLRTEHLRDVVGEAIEILRGEAEDMPGFITGHVLVSIDAKALAIITEWMDSHVWSASRYDKRVGKMLEHCVSNSIILDLELYRRKAHLIGVKVGAGD
jgi:heme-degrading monooxygenase HmoA